MIKNIIEDGRELELNHLEMMVKHIDQNQEMEVNNTCFYVIKQVLAYLECKIDCLLGYSKVAEYVETILKEDQQKWINFNVSIITFSWTLQCSALGR